MAQGGNGGWKGPQEPRKLGSKPPPSPWEAGQLGQKPQDKTWKCVCLMVSVTLLLMVITLSVVLHKVFQVTQGLQEEVVQLGDKVIQGLGDAKHDRDFIRGEMFRQMERVQEGKASSCLPCHVDWKAFQGSCYYFSVNNLTWSQANDSCAQERAHLVIINSQAEQNFLTLTEHIAYWIGLSKEDLGGAHRWADGSAPTYTNWASNNVSSGGLSPACVMMLPHGCWKDFSCNFESTFICEKRQSC